MVYIVFIVIYMVFLFGVGVWKSREVHTQEDFVVAGRKLTAFVLVGTLLATWTGSGSIFNGGRLAYENGYAALWSSAGAWLGIAVIFFIAQKIRRGEKLSVPHILEDRFNKWVGLIATVVTIIAYITIVSYQFKGGGRVISYLAGDDFTLLGMSPVMTGMVLTAILAISYTVIAGMLSVTYTDVINGMVMLAGIAIAIPFVLDANGGMAQFAANVPAPQWQIFGTMGPIQAFAYALPTMLLLMGDANMYQRFLSAKNEREAKKSVVGWIICVIVIEFMIVTLGFLGTGLEKDLSRTESASIIIIIAKSHVPSIIGCFLLAAIAAVIISTADSFLLVPATNFSHDIYQRYLRPQASQKELVSVCRITVLVLGIGAFAMGAFFDTILEAAYAAYTIYGAAITPMLLAAFLWKRASNAGALLSVSGGALVTIGWEIYQKNCGAIRLANIEIAAIFPAILVSSLLLIAGSLIWPTIREET